MQKLILSCLLALLAAPAFAANKEHQQMMADIRMLQEQTQQLHVVLGALTDALKAVTARLDDQAAANRKAFADQKLLVDNLSGDLRVVREKVDDNNVRVAALSQELDALRQVVQQQRSAPRTSSTDAETPPGAQAADPASPPPAGPAPAVGTSPGKLYDAARADYYAGQWDLAVIGFEQYIRSFPKSNDADDAQVLIGNAYYFDGKFDKAVEAYEKAIRNYPTGDAIPEAYYKKGLALRKVNQNDAAREALEFVVKNFPESDAGRLAKQALEQGARR